jgi:hypothetical protein
MTKRFVSVLSLATLVAVLTPLSIVTHAAEITCRIPFSFAVNGKTLPPGVYSLSTLAAALVIRGDTHRAIVLGNPTESRTAMGAKLVFDKYGDEYFLREAWMGGGSGRELPRPRLNRDQTRAALNGPVERVVIPVR